MSGIVFDKVVKRFGDFVAVDEVSFEVADGEFLVLVGPSGCGKTTSLRMLVGLEEPSAGSVLIGGRDVTRIRPKERNVAMVFQDYAVFPHLSVYENIAYGLRARRVARSEIDQRVRNAAATFRIEHLLKQKPRQVSGGERQRIALSRSLVRDANAYLYDEPLSNLDAQLRHQAREDILTLHREKGAPTVYVTHDQSEAMAMGDRIAVMRSGRIQQIGSGTELYERPRNQFVAFFIGTPSINLFDVELRADGADVHAVSDAFDVRLPADLAERLRDHSGRAMRLGVRPEDLHVPKMAPFAVDETNTITGIVDSIEPMASGCSVYLGTVEDAPADFIATFKVRLPASYLGREIPLAMNMDKIHLFDGETEESIRYGTPEREASVLSGQ